jgi:hypothetical protein
MWISLEEGGPHRVGNAALGKEAMELETVREYLNDGWYDNQLDELLRMVESRQTYLQNVTPPRWCQVIRSSSPASDPSTWKARNSL